MGQFRQYQSLESAIKALKLDHFTCDFKFEGKKLCCVSNASCYSPQEMQLVEYHRFEPIESGESIIVYAIICEDGTKGLLIYSYDTKIDMNLISFFDKVRIATEEEAILESKS